MDLDQVIGVVGASARSAVHSLLRAGYKAWAVDLFGDRDLAMVAPCAVCPLEDYPDALPELAKQFPPGPVMYTGGLENHPQVVAELAASRQLWGNPPAVLETVRDPFRLFPLLEKIGFVVPRIVPRNEVCPTTGRWLRKPIRSGGGLGIRFATPGEAASPNHIFQEFIDGVPISTLYRGTTLLWASEQFIGESWLHAPPFAYCGSIGPIECLDDIRTKGREIPSGAGMRGYWNLDFIRKHERAVPVELNPRYSASIELFEHSTHSALFGELGPSALFGQLGIPSRRVGKAIYYAPHDISFPARGPWDADLATPFDPWHLPAFADIPAADSIIPAGHPVLTLLVSGSSPAQCQERLQSLAQDLDQLLAERTP